MFIDSIIVTLTAGKGGDGAIAWRREKYIPKGGPSGGNGGNGGSIYLETDPEALCLDFFRNRRLIRAENGAPGGANHRQGKSGKDLTLKIPCGTLLKDAKTGEILHDFTTPHERLLICRGGHGGQGNVCFKSPTHQAPNIYTPGTAGEDKELSLELKLIADVGLVGMPNAGKSTLLSQVTQLRVKIGAYPFTTLYPNLSYIEFQDYSRVLIADIPGIIEDAHNNRGLGLSFLKHIERSQVLVFLIDISGSEGRDPIKDFAILKREIEAYQPSLLNKPYLIVLNKMDLEGAAENAQLFRENLIGSNGLIFEISALNEEGIAPLVEAMRKLVLVSKNCTQRA